MILPIIIIIIIIIIIDYVLNFNYVVEFWCETWSLAWREEQRLWIFENGVAKKICGSWREGVTGSPRKLD